MLVNIQHHPVQVKKKQMKNSFKQGNKRFLLHHTKAQNTKNARNGTMWQYFLRAQLILLRPARVKYCHC